MKINIKFPKVMKYDTQGDYSDQFNFEIYDNQLPIVKRAVALHEIVESWILAEKGISAAQVTKWDTEDSGGAYDKHMYDKNPDYKAAHQLATKVERAMIEASGWSWKEYSRYCDNLTINWKKPAGTTQKSKNPGGTNQKS